jgi:hypothetical protein
LYLALLAYCRISGLTITAMMNIAISGLLDRAAQNIAAEAANCLDRKGK